MSSQEVSVRTPSTPKQFSSLSREKLKKKAVRGAIAAFFVIYGIITVIPFYFLVIRAFVPTIMATKLHLWVPETEGMFSLDAQYGNLSYYYRFNTEKFKKTFGLRGYIASTMTFREIAEQYGIEEERIIEYMNPRVKFSGWLAVLEDDRFVAAILRNVLVTCASIAFGGLLGIATGSVLARFRKRWHVWTYNTYLVSLIIPGPMVIIPTYIIVARVLGLYNTPLALIMLYIKGSALSTMLFTSYITKMPLELRDSVYVDGGNRIHYFFHILLPLCKVAFGTYAVIHITFFWNDFLNGLLYLDKEHSTLIPMLNAYISAMAINLQAIYAGLCIAIIPLLIVYFLFQRLFVRATFSGALKG
jgi:ABC-type glycerol-3-phosphate transport system permease component